MALTRYEPFREFSSLQDRINWLFGDGYSRDDEAVVGGTLVPPMDVLENDNHDLVITAELPDMKREDIHVTVDTNTLTLRGEKKATQEVTENNYRRVERSYGTFSRSFSLPNTVDASKVSADYKNGVLTVKLPFREEAKPRSIDVQVNA